MPQIIKLVCEWGWEMSQFYQDTLPALTSSISQEAATKRSSRNVNSLLPLALSSTSLHVCAPTPADFQSRAVHVMDRTGVNKMPPPFHPRSSLQVGGSTPCFPLVAPFHLGFSCAPRTSPTPSWSEDSKFLKEEHLWKKWSRLLQPVSPRVLVRYS